MKNNVLSNWFQTVIVALFAAVFSCLVMPSGVWAESELRIGDLEIRTPTVAIPYYHFAMRLNLPKAGPVRIQHLQVNSEPVLNHILLHNERKLDTDQINIERRMAIAPAVKSSRPDRTYESPTLIGRLNWRNGQTCRLDLALELQNEPGKTYRVTAEAAAPEKGGYWNPNWEHYQGVVVSETAGVDRLKEPVEARVLFYPDTVSDLAREVRVVRYDCRKRVHTVIPCQVVDYESFEVIEPPSHNQHGKLKPKSAISTDAATVVFMADVPADKSVLYLVFYGNPNAPDPNYGSDLKVTGTRPGVAVENDMYRLKLHDASGMLDELTLKSKSEHLFVHKKETNGAIQWNPGCYAPPRPWAHLSDWLPGKYDYEYEDVEGPILFKTRRWGQMPMMPELGCSMVYKFYPGQPYFYMSSAVHFRYDVQVQALRNAEVVFAREAYSEAAWWDPRLDRVETRRIVDYPDLTEWIVPDDTPWVAFFDREKGCGYAGIQKSFAYGSIEGNLQMYNPYMYITTGPWIYWVRALVYPYGSRNPQQVFNVTAGSVFLEEWIYLPFELSKGKRMFEAVEKLAQAVPHPLEIHVEDPSDPKMQIPEEIYIEPEKTGWEE